MQGYVNDNCEAVISLVISNCTKLKSIKALIDTGFTGFLSLPTAIITELELPWSYRDRETLGDGSGTVFDIYDATVIGDNRFSEDYFYDYFSLKNYKI